MDWSAYAQPILLFYKRSAISSNVFAELYPSSFRVKWWVHPYFGPTDKTPWDNIGYPNSDRTGNKNNDDGKFLEKPS